MGVPLVAGVGEETAEAPLTFALVAFALVALFTDLGGVASLIGSVALRFWTTGERQNLCPGLSMSVDGRLHDARLGMDGLP